MGSGSEAPPKMDNFTRWVTTCLVPQTEQRRTRGRCPPAPQSMALEERSERWQAQSTLWTSSRVARSYERHPRVCWAQGGLCHRRTSRLRARHLHGRCVTWNHTRKAGRKKHPGVPRLGPHPGGRQGTSHLQALFADSLKDRHSLPLGARSPVGDTWLCRSHLLVSAAASSWGRQGTSRHSFTHLWEGGKSPRGREGLEGGIAKQRSEAGVGVAPWWVCYQSLHAGPAPCGRKLQEFSLADSRAERGWAVGEVAILSSQGHWGRGGGQDRTRPAFKGITGLRSGAQVGGQAGVSGQQGHRRDSTATYASREGSACFVGNFGRACAALGGGRLGERGEGQFHGAG